MDLTDEDTILKLAALGWNGKDDPLNFLKSQFKIITKISKRKGFTWGLEIFWDGGNILFEFNARDLPKVKEITIIHAILKLFHTENGEIICPTKNWDWRENWDKEWT